MANDDIYVFHLASTSKLKMNALGKLADGTPKATFEACVLLHEAARGERRAVESLTRASAATRLSAAIEECWCLVEGRDPSRAAEAWSNVLLHWDQVDVRTRVAMLDRLEPFYLTARDDFAKRLGKCKALVSIRQTGSLVPASVSDAAVAVLEITSVLTHYPGASSLWWAKYRLLEQVGRNKQAWDAISHARSLEPDNSRYLAMSLLLAVRALPLADAELELAAVRARLETAGADVCLLYALAEIELARKDHAKDRWSRALDAANAGIAQATTPSVRSGLRATQLLLKALTSGKPPTLDILYRAGLGSVAAAMPKGDVPLETMVGVVAALAA